MPSKSKHATKQKRARVKGQRGHVSSDDDDDEVNEPVVRAASCKIERVAAQLAGASVSKEETRDDKLPDRTTSKKKKEKKGQKHSDDDEEEEE